MFRYVVFLEFLGNTVVSKRYYSTKNFEVFGCSRNSGIENHSILNTMVFFGVLRNLLPTSFFSKQRNASQQVCGVLSELSMRLAMRLSKEKQSLPRIKKPVPGEIPPGGW